MTKRDVADFKKLWLKKLEAREARKKKIASAIPLAIKKPSQRKEKLYDKK